MPQLSRWRREQESLRAEERSALTTGDDQFIGAETRAAELWDRQLEQARERDRQSREGLAALRQLQGLFGDANKEGAQYGMSPRPEAPDEDFLSCFHQQWNEHKHPDIQGNRTKFLKGKRCKFYYPFGKMGGQALEACEENRKDTQDRIRFCITTILIVASIVVTIMMGLLTLP